ncbi:GxxExxY protein [Patescibacteria group bacterium]|nr:GxxExxY protein [Patescibacteria group bacterium]
MQNKVDNFLYEDISYTIRGCCFKVYNGLGYGHKEIIYQNALAEEFTCQDLFFEREKRLDIFYNNKKIGIYKPDFVIKNKIIVEIKAVEYMPQNYEKQLIYYLKGTNYKLGFLINFGSKNLDIRRRVWSPSYQ